MLASCSRQFGSLDGKGFDKLQLGGKVRRIGHRRVIFTSSDRVVEAAPACRARSGAALREFSVDNRLGERQELSSSDTCAQEQGGPMDDWTSRPDDVQWLRHP